MFVLVVVVALLFCHALFGWIGIFAVLIAVAVFYAKIWKNGAGPNPAVFYGLPVNGGGR